MTLQLDLFPPPHPNRVLLLSPPPSDRKMRQTKTNIGSIENVVTLLLMQAKAALSQGDYPTLRYKGGAQVGCQLLARSCQTPLLRLFSSVYFLDFVHSATYTGGNDRGE